MAKGSGTTRRGSASNPRGMSQIREFAGGFASLAMSNEDLEDLATKTREQMYDIAGYSTEQDVRSIPHVYRVYKVVGQSALVIADTKVEKPSDLKRVEKNIKERIKRNKDAIAQSKRQIKEFERSVRNFEKNRRAGVPSMSLDHLFNMRQLSMDVMRHNEQENENLKKMLVVVKKIKL